MIQIQVAVLRHPGGPFILESATIDAPRADEVLVDMTACGMCHTDMVIRDQIYATPLPIVLGHEGSGVVAAVGDDVRKVAVGDHVVLTFCSCGHCRHCQSGVPAGCNRFNELNFAGVRPDGSNALKDMDGRPLHDRFFAQSSFASHAIANARNVVKVRKDAPLELLGPLGCGIQTGAGTVLNALKVGAGSSFAAFGGGAVGLSAVMAARVAGATTIICVDMVPSRLQLALELGATHVVNARDEDPVERILAITGGGAAFAMDSTANPSAVRQAADALGARGICAIVGAAAPNTAFHVDMNNLMQQGKTIRGVVEGDSIPDFFIPLLIDLHLQDRFPFDRLVKFYRFESINEAAADSEKGATVKPIIVMKPNSALA